jgi:hypothetical protein
MSVRFENSVDLQRETKAVTLFCDTYGLTFAKLGLHDVDFKIYNKDVFLFNLEVKGRIKTLNECFPLPIAVRKLLKMTDKKQEGVIIWACKDGIVFSRVEKLKGEIRMGGRKKRAGSTNDIELMAYYNNNSNFTQLRYEQR